MPCLPVNKYGRPHCGQDGQTVEQHAAQSPVSPRNMPEPLVRAVSQCSRPVSGPAVSRLPENRCRRLRACARPAPARGGQEKVARNRYSLLKKSVTSLQYQLLYHGSREESLSASLVAEKISSPIPQRERRKTSDCNAKHYSDSPQEIFGTPCR